MDLVVGASILFAAIILVTGVLWLKEVSISRKLVDYAVLFPNVGTLQIGDPVMVNGVSKGAVKRIYLHDDGVAVIVEIDREVRLTDSCRIAIQNIGLMGERGIGLQYSGEGSAVSSLGKGDTVFLRGSFDTGIGEAMGMLGDVLGQVQELAGNVASIVGQTVGDSSFLTLFKSIVVRLDSITLAVQDLFGENRTSIDRSIANLATLSEELKKLMERNSPSIDSIVANTEELTSRAVGIMDNIDTLTGSVHTILDQIQDEESTIGMMIKDKTLYRDLQQTVADLDSLVRNVQQDALKLRIKIGFGKKKK